MRPDPSTAAVGPDGQHFRRAAGVALPLFALRGGEDAGSGEILDLPPFIDWLAHWHQRVLQLLPINEAAPGEASPYNALSAFAIDPAYVAATRLPDVVANPAARQWLGSAAAQMRLRRGQQARRRQRRAAYAFKLRLLELAFAAFELQAAAGERGARFAAFCRDNADWVDDYALFRALKERRRWTSWETWPEELRHRDPAALDRARGLLVERIRFFRYVQWVAAEQWEAARAHARGRGVLLKGDLPFVCGRDSADVWAHQELFDLSSSAGAPPDDFSATGQAWGLPLYDWAAMRRSGFAWWRRRARQAGQLYDVFRIDHVVGLYRTYAIAARPGGTAGFVPPDEPSQLAQGQELLAAVLAAAGTAAVVAEDLGTVPDWVRASLVQLRIPGYKVLRWEQRDGAFADPRSFPELSVATTGTHDTDTLAVWWDGLSGDRRQAVAHALGLPRPHGDAAAPAWTTELHLALLRRLYEAGSVWTILPLQDLFGWRERINTPATVDPGNWSFRSSLTTVELGGTETISARMDILRRMIDETGR